MHKKIKLFFLLVLTLLTISSSGQTRIWSPYSRYGVGEISFSKTPFIQSMGGTSIAYRSENIINTANPASYSATDTMSFVSDFGVVFYPRYTSTSTMNQYSLFASLSHLTFAFPIAKYSSVSLGVIPYSNVGYQIQDSDSLPEFGEVLYRYDGYGGINKLYLGNSWNIGNNLSLGINFNYYFGNITRRRIALFDTTNFVNTRFTNSSFISDFNATIGIQYYHDISDDYTLSFGAIVGTPNELNTKNTILAERFSGRNIDIRAKDTVSLEKNQKGSISMPLSIGAGLGFGKKERWYIGIDGEWQNWNKYQANEIKDSLADGLRLSLGGFIVPKDKLEANLFRRAKYLYGIHYYDSYLELKNTSLIKYGISFGLGLPLRKSKTNIQISLELGKMGTTENNLIQETYGMLRIGLNIYEKWFFKRSFD